MAMEITSQASLDLSADCKSPVSTVGCNNEVPLPVTPAYPNLSTSKSIFLCLSMSATSILHFTQIQGIVMSLNRIGQDLDMPVANYTWPTLAYSLAFSSMLLLFGRLADIYGHRAVYFASMIWFTIWSLAGGFAPNEIALDVFRAMQGMAMSAAIPASLGILGSTFAPGPAKTWAFAAFSAGAPTGGGVGSLLGGVLADFASWRWFFWISCCVGFFITVTAFFTVPETALTITANKRVDWVGGFLVTAGLVLVTFALSDGSSEPQGWRTPFIPALFCVGVLLCGVFLFWERHLEVHTDRPPLMRISLWFKGRFAAVAVIALLSYASFAPFVVFSTSWNQTVTNVGALGAAVRFLPAVVLGGALCGLVGLFAARVSAIWLAAIGSTGIIVAPLLFALQDTRHVYWRWQFPAFAISAIGPDCHYTLGILYASKMADPSDQALSAGILNMMTQLGTSLGLAILTAVQTSVVKAHSDPAGPEAAESGLRGVFYGCLVIAGIALLVSVTCLQGVGRVGVRGRVTAEASEEDQGVKAG